ncbi:hypothetical protein GCM10010345_89480 [Streptomyces canarius]|uniref:Uncharacterized protein n=1 Tax=Streptomyces canarius TaxID=285453 RepID=A0ABQ3DG83_9ACTN|nr:hypothetical protein GCM10010345_89480 [Streptomyces canarius]
MRGAACSTHVRAPCACWVCGLPSCPTPARSTTASWSARPIEGVGAWVVAQRHGWDKLSPAQQWLPGGALGVEPAAPEARPVKVTVDQMRALNLRGPAVPRP